MCPTEQRAPQRFNWCESVAIVAVASASIFKLNSRVEWLAVPPLSDQKKPPPRSGVGEFSRSGARSFSPRFPLGHSARSPVSIPI